MPPIEKTGPQQGKPTGTREIAEGQGADKQRSIRRQNEAADVLAYAGYRVENCPTVTSADGLAALKDSPDYRIEGLIFDGYAPFSLLASAANPLLAFQSLTEADRQEAGAKMKEILALYTLGRMEQQEKFEFDEFDDDISDTSVWAEYRKAKLAYALAAISSQIRQKVSSGQTRNVVVNLADSICTPENVIGQLVESPVSRLSNLICINPRRDAQTISTHRTKDGGYRLYRASDFDIAEHNFSTDLQLEQKELKTAKPGKIRKD
jgi:hypothetical protein